MGLFDNVLRADQTLIKNVDALDYEFLPKILRYRENQQQYLATCIKPLFNKMPGRNLFIYGAPGIGKTAAARAVFHAARPGGERHDHPAGAGGAARSRQRHPGTGFPAGGRAGPGAGRAGVCPAGGRRGDCD